MENGTIDRTGFLMPLALVVVAAVAVEPAAGADPDEQMCTGRGGKISEERHSQPVTRRSLLEKLKLAFDRGRLLDRAFYDQASLAAYFPGNLRLHRNDHDKISGFIYFGYAMPDKALPDNMVNVDIDFDYSTKEGGQARASWRLGLGGFVTYEDVVDIFGDNWENWKYADRVL